MIITVSREFGSGGRELGKRLSDALQIPCYDNEIIAMVAKNHGFDESYVASVSEKSIQSFYPLTIGTRFSTTFSCSSQQGIKVAVEQRKIIEALAAQGDCIIVGRGADVILEQYKPFNIFVYADREHKLQRCISRSPEGEHLTKAEMLKKMRQIDKERAQNRMFYTDRKWGAKKNYHLCVNTTGLEVREIVPVLAEYIKVWFAQRDCVNQ